MEKSKRVYILSFLIILGFSLSIIFHYIRGFYLNETYPANTFLFLPRLAFSDFSDVYFESISLNPYLGEKSGQYPFMILIGKLFAILPSYISLPFFLLISMGVFGKFAVNYLIIDPWYIHAASVFIICFLSYPFLFTIDRANFELLLFLLLLLFIYLFEKKEYLWSTIPLALAIAMKIYPAIFLILFISEKRWREVLISIATVIILTLGSLILFHGGIYQNINYLLHFSNFSNNSFFILFTSIEPGTVIQRGVSIVSLVKIILGNSTTNLSTFWINNFSKIYMVIASIIGFIIILHVLFKEKILWKRISILVFLMLLLPPLSADYKLIHLYIPIFLFCNNIETSKLDSIYIILFSILMIPKDYYYFPKLISDAWVNNQFQHDISIGMPINICVLILFTILLMISNNLDIFRDDHNITVS